MSSTSMLPNSIAPSSPPDATIVCATIERLRAEHDAATTATTRALLLHEIGVLEESLGDEAAAARDQLSAVNIEPEFREPLERLIAIIERRQSYKNLGKLLERLVRIADTPEERTRALVEQAAFLLEHEQNADGARATLLEAAAESPDDSSVWLGLELVAARVGDPELAERALTRRAELANDAGWRALLLLNLAEVLAERGDADRALATLERAVGLGGETAFFALRETERIARQLGRADVEAKALETQGAFILRALADPTAGSTLGVPRTRRHNAHVVDVWLRAADLHRRRGEAGEATALLDRLLAEVPDDPVAVHARLTLAEAAGDAATAARLSEAELALGVSGELGAALHLRIAEAAAADGDAERALEAATKAIGLAPACIPARALELDLLATRDDAARFATALESAAEQLESDAAKANLYLTSADVWARLARDISGAKAALSQAAMFGTSPSVVARVARLLASVIGDTGWFEEATRRLLSQGASEDEHGALWFELARARARRTDVAGARLAFDAIAASAQGAWLGHALGAYAAPLIAPPPNENADEETVVAGHGRPWAALESLAATEPDVEVARALRLVVARRALQHGDHATAMQELEALHGSDPSDLVATSALSLLLRDRGELAGSRDVLSRTATVAADAELVTALNLASGALSWRLGEHKDAIDAFTRAAEDKDGAAAVMLGWALRAAEPNDPRARARALDALEEHDPALAAIERFALEVGRGGSIDAADEALASLSNAGPEDLVRTAELARALWAPGPSSVERRRDALEILATRGPEIAKLARAALHQLELAAAAAGAPPDPARALDTAGRWAKADPGVAPTLEWLAAAIAARVPEEEVAARCALAERLEGSAAAMVRASAALVAELSGESSVALADVDDPAIRLARLELAAPSLDPGERARALLGATAVLGEESTSIVAAMAGFNQLAAGDIDGALGCFREVVEAQPEEVIGWEGLRAAALAKGDRATLAEASAALGDAVSDAELGAKLWEEAATILFDELGDPARGEFALGRAVDRDVTRFSAFDRLFRAVRARKDGPRLLELIELRLEVASEQAEIVKLHWERARALRESGDREGALVALEQVRKLEPDHVGALALAGEISITLQRFPEAAENLERLSRHGGAPQQQRLMSGVAAADLYENRLKDPERAFTILTDLYRAGVSTLPVRERLARIAAKVGAWEQATEVLEQLMQQRETRAGRIEAARLAIAIYRDELEMPEAAQDAVAQLLSEAPDDGEALDLVLTSVFAESVTRAVLELGLKVLTESLSQNPLDTERVDRVARIADKLDLTPLRQAALGVLVALGTDTSRIDPELARLDQRVAPLPRMAIDPGALPNLADPEDQGPIGELMKAIASHVAEALGPTLAALGVGKKERVDPRAGLAVRNDIAKWAGALGIAEFDLYVGGRDPEGVFAIPTEVPAIVVGSGVKAPLSAWHRQAVARELLALRRGTTILRHREADEVHALIVAACRLVEVNLPSPPFALLGEFQRQLDPLPRRVRKALPDLARAVQRSGQDPVAWYRAATSTLDRMAAIAAGDVSWVLARDAQQRGRIAPTAEADKRARRLLSFVLSKTYLELRDKLGMGVR